MRKTYINDNKTQWFPFLQKPPFPDCCIIDLSIAVPQSMYTQPLYVSSVTLSKELVRLVICADDAVLGTMEADLSAGYTMGTLKSPDPEVKANGFITVGTIPERAYGTYTGIFRLDPSCVLRVPDIVTGKHKKLTINGNTYTLSQSLQLIVSDYLYTQTQDNTVTLKLDEQAKDLSFVKINKSLVYPGITSLNGYPVQTQNSVSMQNIELTTDYQDIISFSVSGNIQEPGDPQSVQERLKTAGTVLVVQIHGNQKFPNCYDPQQDQAKLERPDTDQENTQETA